MNSETIAAVLILWALCACGVYMTTRRRTVYEMSIAELRVELQRCRWRVRNASVTVNRIASMSRVGEGLRREMRMAEQEGTNALEYQKRLVAELNRRGVAP